MKSGKDDPRRNRSAEVATRRGSDRDAASHGRRPAPGKVTRSGRRAGGASQPVQRKAAVSGAAPARPERKDPYAWLDTALQCITPGPGRDAQPVQARGGGELAAQSDQARSVHEIADAGVSGAGAELPHRERIQEAFGRHDVSGIEVSRDRAAEEAKASLGARAYTTGERIALGTTSDLHTVAHEAAHVIQQRAGVHLAGGMGEEGDAYEQHADAVADQVVQGRSAEPLLDRFAGRAAQGGASVQRAVQLDGDQAKRVEEAKELLREIDEALEDGKPYVHLWDKMEVGIAKKLNARRSVLSQFQSSDARPTAKQIDNFNQARVDVLDLCREYRSSIGQSFLAAQADKLFPIDDEKQEAEDHERERPKKGGNGRARDRAKDAYKGIAPAYQRCYTLYDEMQGYGLSKLTKYGSALDQAILDFQDAVADYEKARQVFEDTCGGKQAQQPQQPEEGTQLWLSEQVVQQGATVTLSGNQHRAYYVSNFDDPLRGQYSREYDVNAQHANGPYVVHIHWGGDGSVRHAKVKKAAERFQLGAGHSIWIQFLRDLNIPVQGPEHIG